MQSTRRHFLMGALAAPAMLPVRRTAAADKVVIGCMGLGGRGSDLMRMFAKHPDVEIAWLADVDASRLGPRVDELDKLGAKKPKTTQDFRRVLEDKSVDAVINATPDHWHALGTILACQAGKDVYVEKPASYCIFEGRRMVEAARNHKRVVQVGAQNRSAQYVKDAVEYARSGKLGDIHYVRVLNSIQRSPLQKYADEPTPAGVDYDMWLGPARFRPFNRRHFHGSWYWLWEYSGGNLVNDGVHQVDLARLVIDRPYPKAVFSTGGIYHFQDEQDTPDTHLVNWDYDGLTMSFEQLQWAPYQVKTPMNLRDRDVLPKWPFNGTRIEVFGTKQWMMFGRHSDGWECYDGDGKTVAFGYGRQANHEHQRNFIECIRSRKQPNADIEQLHLSTLLCHYGNISYRTGRKLEIDPTTEAFKNAPEANRLAKRATYRSPWIVPDKV